MRNKRQAIACMANKQEAMSFPAHPECAVRQMDKLKKRDRQGIEGFLQLSQAGLLGMDDNPAWNCTKDYVTVDPGSNPAGAK
jgi:hypothetical protein